MLNFWTVATPFEHVERARGGLAESREAPAPQIIVLKDERWTNMVAHPQAKPFTEALIEDSEAHRIELRLLAQDAMYSTFRDLGCETKAEIAAALVTIFPDLVWQLPPWTAPPRHSVS